MATEKDPTRLVKKTAVLGRTVRQRIMDALTDEILAMEEDGEKVFRAVYFGDPEFMPNTTTPFVAIDCGTEDKVSIYGGCQIYELPVFFYFRWQNREGLDAADTYLYYLGILQMAVLANHNLGSLAQNVEENSNAHTIFGTADAYPGGSLNVTITYKTRLHNPYKSIHES
jgi:hypothetical protein